MGKGKKAGIGLEAVVDTPVLIPDHNKAFSFPMLEQIYKNDKDGDMSYEIQI